MDVVCGRCRAEYEFDDALISERGTTVRCTSCGLQFKVFPPAGLRAPEEWNVFDPHDPAAPSRRYESLRDLQKAIARGEVLAQHLLARGEEIPRPLAEIVELQPLLRQPRSDRPPPRSAEPDPPLGNPAALHTAIAEETSALQGEEDAESGGLTPEGSTGHVAGQPSRPRIRSALSIHASADQRTTPPPSTGTRDLSTTSIAPRASLRSTLASNYPPSSSGASSSATAAPQAVEDQARPSSIPPSPRAAQEAPSPPPVQLDEERPSFARPSSTVVAPVNPRITEAQDFTAQLTPTPGAMKAIRSVNTDPGSARVGMPMRRGARSGAIVMAAVIGAVAFLGFANREKIADLLGSNRIASSGSRPEKSPLSEETRKGLIAVEVAWIKEHLLDVPVQEIQGVPAERQGQLFQDLERSGEGKSWMKVDLLRAAGQLQEARALSGNLTHGAQSAYSLSLLDLSSSPDDPPWPVILERLREASIGEGPPYLATVVYIYALENSGEKVQASAEFQAFSQMAGAKNSPLFAPLETLVHGGEEAEGEPDEAAAFASKEAEKVPGQAGTNDSAPTKTQDESAATSEGKAVDEAERAKSTEIPSSVQRKVDQADALWRGGDRDGALALYRQVVAGIGTKHFLGQRSAARIRQAEREKATSK